MRNAQSWYSRAMTFDARLARIQRNVRALVWMMGINLALTAVVFVKTWDIGQVLKDWGGCP